MTTATAAATGTKIVYDRETCSRCLGTGMHGPLSVYGGRCFKCNQSGKGDGTVLTRSGANALAAMNAWAEEHLMVPASSLQPGDRINDHGSTRVVVSRETTLGRGNCRSMTGVEGTDSYTETWQLGVTVLRTKKTSLQTAAHAPVRLAWTPETLRQAAAEVLKRRKGWAWAD